MHVSRYGSYVAYGGLCRWCRGVHVVALTIFSFLHLFPLNTPMLREVCRLLIAICMTTCICYWLVYAGGAEVSCSDIANLAPSIPGGELRLAAAASGSFTLTSPAGATQQQQQQHQFWASPSTTPSTT